MHLALEVQDNGDDKTCLQVRWTGSYTSTSQVHCQEPLRKLGERAHLTLERGEAHFCGGNDRTPEYVRRYGQRLAEKIGLSDFFLRQAQSWKCPVKIELGTCGAVDALPLEILPWYEDALGLSCYVYRMVHIEGANEPPACDYNRGFRSALIVTTANPDPELQLADETRVVRGVFEKNKMKTAIWQADASISLQDNISLLKSRMENVDILHIAGHTDLGKNGGLRLQLDGVKKWYCSPADLEKVKRMPRIVWMNTCHSASIAPQLDSFAAVFLTKGSLAFIGAGARLKDTHIQYACHKFYAEVLRGSCLAEAMRQARIRLKHHSRNWALLRLYGYGDKAIQLARQA